MDFDKSTNFNDEPSGIFSVPKKDYSKAYAELATLNPLKDDAFKISLSNEKLFRCIVEAIMGRRLSDGIININNEVNVSVNGKTIKVDVLMQTHEEFINMEGQQSTAEFPFERHLYYWSVIFSNTIDGGETFDYTKVQPVTVIVIYKNRRGYPLLQEAWLDGPLTPLNFKKDRKSDKNKQLLTLVAVNSAEWAKAIDPELKLYLALLHKGLTAIEDHDVAVTEGVVTGRSMWIYDVLRDSCQDSLLKRAERNKDKEMVEMYKNLITEEKEAAVIKSKIEIYYKEMKLTPEQIADKMDMEVEDVKTIITQLK